MGSVCTVVTGNFVDYLSKTVDNLIAFNLARFGHKFVGTDNIQFAANKAVGYTSTLAPQLRITLSQYIRNDFVITTPWVTFADNTSFPQFFKGIYIMSTPAAGAGSIVSFSLLNPLSNITLYYHQSLVISTAYSYNFIMDNGTVARINHFNHTKYFYADTYLRNELAGGKDTVIGNKYLYVQSMAGLKVRIQYPYLKNLTKKGRIAINKADLIIPVDDSTYASESSLSTYAPPYQLVLLEEQNGLIRYLLDQYEGTSYFGGIYNAAKKEYKFNIARHIQQIVDGIKENYGLSVWFGQPTDQALQTGLF